MTVVPVAGRTTIDLGARATVLESVERIASSPADGDLVLSIAPGAPVARNAVFFEVARRAAGSRRLAIVSPDARARALASSVHVPAFASATALERHELDATEPLTAARRAALVRPVRPRRVGPSPLRILGVFASLLAAAVVLAGVVAPTATVVVAPVSKALGPFEFDLRAGPEGDITSARTLAGNVSAKYTADATDSRTEESKAKGVARFSNQSTQDVRIPKFTFVRTRENVRFQTTEEKVIPRSQITVIPPFVTFGTADIPIEAVEAGLKGNVPANSITFSDRSEYSVTNPQATTGGDSKKIPLVSQADYTRAAARADEELRKAGVAQVEKWKQEARKGEVVYGAVTKQTSITPASDVVGKEQATFELTVTGTARGYAVPDSEPRAATIAKLKQQADPGNDVDADHAVVDVVIAPIVADNGVTWRVRGRASQFIRLNEAALRAGLAGREFIEAQDILRSSGVELKEVTFWPGWWPRLPLLDSRIVISTSANDTAPSP